MVHLRHRIHLVARPHLQALLAARHPHQNPPAVPPLLQALLVQVNLRSINQKTNWFTSQLFIS